MNGIVKVLRSPLAKVLERLIAYGAVALLMSLGLGEPEAQEEVAAWVPALAFTLAGALLLGAQLLLDLWHHKKDRAEPPPAGFADLPVLVILAAVATLLVAGCTAGPVFRLDAYAELGNAVTELERGAAEAQLGLTTRLDQEEGQKQDALAEALKIAAAVPEGEREALVDERLAQFWGQWAVVQDDRAAGRERFRRVEEWVGFSRLLLARLMTLERENQTVQEQLAEYRQLAESAARRQLGLAD
jgi:hypothetical protein